MSDVAALMLRACQHKIVIPGFNIPYLPMMEPVVRALRDCGSFGLIEVARLEWEKFQAKSLKAVKETYDRCGDARFTRLHLDHVPVIDEDHCRVDYLAIIKEALALGYESVMVDGSRLPLAENIAATRNVVELAHAQNVPVEAELGAVAGHEKDGVMDYESLFASAKGFTDLEEAHSFVTQTKVDWLSIAFGNIHGAISKAQSGQKKVTARLAIDHLQKLRQVAPVPMVLHGGSGIEPVCIRQAVADGIGKINIGTTIRQAYEKNLPASQDKALNAVYDSVCDLIKNELHILGSAQRILGKNA